MEMFLSQMWSFLGLLTVLQNVLPTQLLTLLHSLYDSLQDLLTPFSYYDVPEFNAYSSNLDPNHFYRHVSLYLNSLHSASSARCLSLSRSPSGRLAFSLAPGHSLPDTFLGHRLSWTHHVDTLQDSLEEKRSFTLKLPKRHRHALLLPYLDHVSSSADAFDRQSRHLRLSTNNGNAWVYVPFNHPSSFNTLALDPDLKRRLTDDLSAFSTAKEYYHSVGRAWKRGYLLYGPPGSGKSSLIAAMANFLNYDVYDLELTKVSDNSELRALLMQTTNRSIIVIEDIDCSLDLTTFDRRVRSTNHKKSNVKSNEKRTRGGDNNDGGRVTLSGLLNFTDGLWSCCGEERIIVFTTNHKDHVDPALVRPGRMDMHVRLGVCGAHALKELARNYLGLEDHPMFDVVESCMRAGGALTPAEIGEMMLKNRRDPNVAMKEVVAALQGSIVKGGGGDRELGSCWSMVDEAEGTMTDRGLLSSPENWGIVSSPERVGGKRRKERSNGGGDTNGTSTWERKVKFLVRLKSLTKSDSGRGV
ncbi:hypothetical protein Scep_003652 [Stephania cephalantha]|uniref:AAA+ ATPase domain-containing protein n=1 Tax=Stephania cephalantha TaxID=152367 RepID=A0AAP0KQX1_9MAGN